MYVMWDDEQPSHAGPMFARVSPTGAEDAVAASDLIAAAAAAAAAEGNGSGDEDDFLSGIDALEFVEFRADIIAGGMMQTGDV